MPTAYTDSLVQNLLALLSTSGSETEGPGLALRSESLAALTDILLNTADSARYVNDTARLVLQSNILQSRETVQAGLEVVSAVLQVSPSQSLLPSLAGRILSSVLDLLQAQSEPSDSLVRRSVGILGDLALHHPHTFSSLSQ